MPERSPMSTRLLELDAPSTWRVLLAEDDPVSRLFTQRVLENAGYEVIAVTNGRQAIEALRTQFCPILLTDWEMPELDGLGVVQAVRDGSWPGYVFTVLLTGRDSRESVLTGLDAGADDYLTKPVDQAELLVRIKSGRRIADLEQRLRAAEAAATRLSLTDSLTGLPNRRFLDQKLSDELERARRFGHPLSLALADLDHFKDVNDHYGHAVGDRVLRTFGQLLSDLVRRQVDWAARYGGEEFVIVLPETAHAGALILAEKLRAATEALRIEVDGVSIPITASFGVATVRLEPELPVDPEGLIALADERLYESKRGGRNRVTGE
jgi:two-component system cell cycle response regulator